MTILVANTPGESGRGVKTILPPRSTKEIPSRLSLDHQTTLSDLHRRLLTPRSLAKRGVFVVNVQYEGPANVILYNGGLETQWIQHGETIAEYEAE